MVTKVTGAKGAKGANGKNPTAGGNGQDATFSQNGKIGADSMTIKANGGDGGNGGKNTGTGEGGAGGNGGNAGITLNGNIFNAPATTNLVISGTATGGDGGDAGANGGATVGGSGGKGGNANVTFNGNIIQPPKAMNNIELDAIAVGGAPGGGSTLGQSGNATATINGNIVQPSKAATVTLAASASSAAPDSASHDGDTHFGTKTATINGNIVQGNINTVTLSADAFYSNGTASLNGNIVQTTGATSGTVTLEASGNHISITKNKVQLGKQELDLTINEYAPYDTTISGNEFTGNGTNTFVFTDNAMPGPTTDTASADLSNNSFTFNNKTNKLTNFANLTFNGNGNYTLTGNAGNNILIGGSGNDTFIVTAGNDTYDGGAGSDTLKFTSATGPLTVDLSNINPQAIGGGYGTDTLLNLENIDASTTTFGNRLFGNAADNMLTGGAGNDVFFGGTGTNTLTGGGGTDVAYYHGREATYTTATLTQVTGGPDAVNDTLGGIARLKFLSPSHVSDVDNNGYGDLVFQNSANGNIQVRTQSGGGPATVTINAATAWNVIGTGQFSADTDRTAGLLLQNTANNKLEVITGVTTATPVTTLLSTQPGAGWNAIATGDFNGDATSDILLQNSTTHQAEILFMGGAPGQVIGGPAAVTTPGANWNVVSSGDFNGDGNSDILWQNSASGQVEVTLMNGATATSTPTALSVPAGYKAIGSGDFNNDGDSDILFQTGGPGTAAAIWTMNGDAPITGAPSTIAAPTTGGGTFTLMGAEDVNNNGFSDLLWQDTSTGKVVATEMTTGGTVLGNVTLGSPASAFHLVASAGGG